MDKKSIADYRNPSLAALPNGPAWGRTVAGTHALAWEQAQIDHWVSDAFGYHALQLGLPDVQALRHNRMPHRWVVAPQEDAAGPDVCAEFHALPFAAASVDLVVMPHTLEFTADAHQTLREVDRVLRPEGRLLITGFNPASLWGLARRRDGWNRSDWIGYWRLRDWLRLLSFEVESGRFGCYVPPVGHAAWLERLRWMDTVGDRWWPVLGGVYALIAVKRVRGVRMLGLSRSAPKARKTPAPAVAAQGRHRLLPFTEGPTFSPTPKPSASVPASRSGAAHRGETDRPEGAP